MNYPQVTVEHLVNMKTMIDASSKRRHNDTAILSCLKSSKSQFYTCGRDHLSDELVKIEIMLHRQVLRHRKNMSDGKVNEFAGLCITDDEISRLLNKKPKNYQNKDYCGEEPKTVSMTKTLELLQSQIARKMQLSKEKNVYLPLLHLAHIFHLTIFELNTILLCSAPELNNKFAMLYAYLQNDVTKKFPSINLITELLCFPDHNNLETQIFINPNMPLLKYHLIKFDGSKEHVPGLRDQLKIDARILDFLLGSNLPDYRITDYVKMINPETTSITLSHDMSVVGKLKGILYTYENSGNGDKFLIYLKGPDGSEKKVCAEAFSKECGYPVIMTNLAHILEGKEDVREALRLLFREALLQGAVIFMDNFDVLFADDRKSNHYREIVLKTIREYTSFCIVSGSLPWYRDYDSRECHCIEFEISKPTYSMRRKIWKSIMADVDPGASELCIDGLAGKFKFTTGQIRNAIDEAKNKAMPHPHSNKKKITVNDLYKSCRSQSNQKLSRMARKIVSHYSWNDIVLPLDKITLLREICSFVTYHELVYEDWGFERKLSLGKGVNILFHGRPGTGKTMASEIIAGELSLDLYKIDLSCIVSKYIGETEKNLARIFREAETSNAILLFDEADALFGKRSEVKDSHDRYANIEINYLLQKMEEHEGIVILATNFLKNIDDAFMRRMQFSIEFPFPDKEHRLIIWRNIFPRETPTQNDIDFEFLAKNFEFSGGSIKNIALHAAFLAADDSKIVNMEHIVKAVKRECQKMGKLCSKAEFGKYYAVIYQ